MYRGPCVGIIYTHPFRVGGIQQLFPPSVGNRSCHQQNLQVGMELKSHQNKTKMMVRLNKSGAQKEIERPIPCCSYSIDQSMDYTPFLAQNHGI